MTTFGWEPRLLEPILKAGVKVILANDWNRHEHGRTIEKEYYGYKNLTLLYPYKDPGRSYYGAFHPKLWLL